MMVCRCACDTAAFSPTDRPRSERAPPLLVPTTVSFRCSTATKAQAEARAESEGVSISTALRSLLSDYAHERLASPQLAKASGSNAEELRRIGLNLNQIARSLNTGIVPDRLAAKLADPIKNLAKAVRRTHTLLVERQLPTKP